MQLTSIEVGPPDSSVAMGLSSQYTATGLYSEPVAAEFLEHAQEEQAHADKLAQRIVQLGGEPDVDLGDQVAVATALELGHAETTQAQLGTVLGERAAKLVAVHAGPVP